MCKVAKMKSTINLTEPETLTFDNRLHFVKRMVQMYVGRYTATLMIHLDPKPSSMSTFQSVPYFGFVYIGKISIYFRYMQLGIVPFWIWLVNCFLASSIKSRSWIYALHVTIVMTSANAAIRLHFQDGKLQSNVKPRLWYSLHIFLLQLYLLNIGSIDFCHSRQN